MAEGKKKLKKPLIITIIIASVLILVCVAIIIVNIFIPIRYFSAYCVGREEREQGVLRVTYVDVGFGDCTVAELPDGKVMLIDSGNGEYNNVLSVLKVLNGRSIDVIDYLVCTSVKSEHCGGFSELLKYKKVLNAFIPKCNNTRITDDYHSFITALEKQGAETCVACVGEGVAEEEHGYFFTFLSPVTVLSPESEYVALNKNPTAENIENASVITWLQYGETAFAFTSDVGKDVLKRVTVEYDFCKQIGQPFCAVGDRSVKLEDCDVVSVAGHGGADNTYAPWFDVCKPERAIISVGANFASYPSLISMADATAYAKAHYTMYGGNITVRSTAEKYDVWEEKS